MLGPGIARRPRHRRCDPDDVEEPPAHHIDEDGHVDRVVDTVGRQHLVLVDAEGTHPLEAARVVDQGSAVATYALHGARPATPKVFGRRGDRGAVLADQPTDLLGRPPGQRSLDQLTRLGEGPHLAVRVPTEPRRFFQTSRTGRPPMGRSRTWTTERPCPTATLPQPGQPSRGRRLHEDEDLAVLLGGPGPRIRPFPAERPHRNYRSVMSRVPSILGCQLPQESGATGPYWWIPIGGSPGRHRPTPEREEPEIHDCEQESLPNNRVASCQHRQPDRVPNIVTVPTRKMMTGS